MNQYILFVGGIILGILIALTLVRNDFNGSSYTETLATTVTPPRPVSSNGAPSSTKLDVKQSNPTALHLKSGEITSLKVDADVLSAMLAQPPVTSPLPPTTTTPSQRDLLLSKDKEIISTIQKQKETIRWAPGKENNLEKYKKDAAMAQASVISGDKRRSQTIDQMMNKLSENNFNDTRLQMKVLKMMKKTLPREEGEGKGHGEEGLKKTVPLPVTSSSMSWPSVAYPSSQSHVDYHQQCQIDFSSYVPHVPTLSAEQAAGRPGPDMQLQRAVYEKDNLKLHLCNGVFEAYSAAYLTTKQHMIEEKSDRFNLSWVNCEMASFVYMRQSNRFYKHGNLPGIIMQTLDVLDFSVIHLSAYERSNKKYIRHIWSNRQDQKDYWSRIDNIIYTGKVLQQLNDPKQRSRSIHYSHEAKRTVVLMPFLGGAMGAGHSELGNRFEYLKTCFWSLYEFFPSIIVAVARAEDVQWAWNASGLPFYDVMLLQNLPKSAGLPVGSTQMLRQRLIDGVYDFDYVFYTESDQILITRELPMLYRHLKIYPGHMILPHRLMPYSAEALMKGLGRDDIIQLSRELFNVTRSSSQEEGESVIKPVAVKTITAAMTSHSKQTLDDNSNTLLPSKMRPPIGNKWMTQSCCLPRQNCLERKSWKSLRDRSVPIIQYYGMYVPLGNVNFLREDYRSCQLMDYVDDYCP